MSFYSQTIFPYICDFTLRQPELAPYRREVLAAIDGDILEIGFGTGLNLPHYPPQVRKIVTVDPNAGMHRLARKRIEESPIEVEHRLLECERLPFADGTFDCVVSTFTLCSIDDVRQALTEVYRVLKLGGRLFFLEHGLSPAPGVQKWQRRLNWLQMRLAGGCRLDRNIKQLATAPPFANVQVDEFEIEKFPKTHGHMYRGSCTK